MVELKKKLDGALKSSDELLLVLNEENSFLTSDSDSAALIEIVRRKDGLNQKLVNDVEQVLNMVDKANKAPVQSLSLFIKSLNSPQNDGIIDVYDKIMANLQEIQSINLKNGFIVNGLSKVNSEILSIVTGTSSKSEVTYGRGGSKSTPRKGSVKISEV